MQNLSQHVFTIRELERAGKLPVRNTAERTGKKTTLLKQASQSALSALISPRKPVATKKDRKGSVTGPSTPSLFRRKSQDKQEKSLLSNSGKSNEEEPAPPTTPKDKKRRRLSLSGANQGKKLVRET